MLIIANKTKQYLIFERLYNLFLLHIYIYVNIQCYEFANNLVCSLSSIPRIKYLFKIY